MRGAARAQGVVRRLTWLVLAALLTFAAGSVYAAKVKVTPQSSGYVRMGQNADGSTRWGTKSEWEAWFNDQMAGGAAAGASRHYTTTGAISSNTIGGFARKAIRGGVYGAVVGAAVTGIVEGAGWAINELRDQVVVPGVDQEQLGEKVYCLTSSSQSYCASAPGQLVGIVRTQMILPAQEPPCGVGGKFTHGGNYYWCTRKTDGAKIQSYLETPTLRPVTGWPGNVSNANPPSTPPVAVTDEQLGDAIRQNPQLVDDLLTDPRTGRPIMTPELQQQGQELQQKLEQEHGLDPSGPITQPDLDDDTANDPGSPWPSFCSWAGVVCDFIDWFKKPGETDVDLPEREIEVNSSGWTSGVGDGSCPAAQEFSVSIAGTTGRAAFEFQPLCDFATTMRPILIAVCSLIAVFIISGLRSSAGVKA